MRDWKQLACREADLILSQALGYPVPVHTRKSRGERVSNPAPRAFRLDGAAVLEQLSPNPKFFQAITLENGFFNFYFSSAWYTWIIEDSPVPAARREISAFQPSASPAALSPEDLRFLTALYSCLPHWTLAARQDQGNPAWLVRYTQTRLCTLEGYSPSTNTFSREIRKLLCLAADYPSVCNGASKILAQYLYDLSKAVWDITPQRLPQNVRHCMGNILKAGLCAFELR